MKREIFICIALAAITLANDVEDAEQKKRGAGKPNALNAIPTGAQKPEYTYIYTQSSNPSQSYQSQPSNSFYPNQPSQYYTLNSESQSSSSQATVPQTTSQFIPINFVPNSAYQQKYQIVQPKPNNNVQLAVLQQPAQYPTPSLLQYPQMVLANPTNHIGPHAPIFNTPNFNFPQYQLPGFGNPFVGHPSMLYVPPVHPNVYNNVPSIPAQNFVSYYQPKYQTPSASAISSNDYEKLHTSVAQASPKDDSESAQTDYISSDSNNAFKNAYNAARSTYAKA